MSDISSKKLTKDLQKIKKLSSYVEDKLAKLDKNEAKIIENFSAEELNDFQKILQITDFILTKYQNKKEVYSILKEFVDMISKSTSSMDSLHDQISELVLSADNSISRIKNLQTDVSDTYSLRQKTTICTNATILDLQKTSTNNLTKSTTGVYT